MLGERLRAARERAGLTQAELSRRSGVAQGYISQLEAGTHTDPGAKRLSALARALGIAALLLAALCAIGATAPRQ